MLAEIGRLLELQTIDNQLRDLAAHRQVLERKRIAVENHVSEQQDTLEQQRANVSQLEHDSLMRNLEVDELDSRIRGYRERLEVGIISFKEMEDLRIKIESEQTRISTMEDQALSLMDSIEAARQNLKQSGSDLESAEAQLQLLIDEITTELANTGRNTALLSEKRVEVAAALSPYVLSQYESLRAMHADPVAEVKQGTCAGCKLKLSGNTVERAKGGLGVVACEHCARMLYVP